MSNQKLKQIAFLRSHSYRLVIFDDVAHKITIDFPNACVSVLVIKYVKCAAIDTLTRILCENKNLHE